MKKLLIGAMGALTLLAGGTAAYTVMHATPAYAANAKAVVDQGIAAGFFICTIASAREL